MEHRREVSRATLQRIAQVMQAAQAAQAQAQYVVETISEALELPGPIVSLDFDSVEIVCEVTDEDAVPSA